MFEGSASLQLAELFLSHSFFGIGLDSTKCVAFQFLLFVCFLRYFSLSVQIGLVRLGRWIEVYKMLVLLFFASTATVDGRNPAPPNIINFSILALLI